MNDRGALVVASFVANAIRIDSRPTTAGRWGRTARVLPGANLTGTGRLHTTVDAAGRAVVTAVLPPATGGATTRVVTISRAPGGAWTTLAELSGGEIRGVAVDTSGAAVAHVVTNGLHRLARRDPATLTWQTSAPLPGPLPGPVPAYSGVSAANSPVAVNGRGDVAIALSEANRSPYVISWARAVADPAGGVGAVRFAAPGAEVGSLALNRVGGWVVGWTSAPANYDAGVDLRLSYGSLYSKNQATRPLTRGRSNVVAGLAKGLGIGLIRRVTGPGGRGPAIGFAVPAPIGLYDPRIYDRRVYDRLRSRTIPCAGFVTPLVVEPIAGRAITACAYPEQGAAIRVFSFRAPTGLKVTVPKTAFRRGRIVVRLRATSAGIARARLRNERVAVSAAAIAPRGRTAVLRMRVPNIRGPYELRICFTPVAKPQRCEVRTVTVR